MAANEDGKLDVRNITNELVDVDDWESVGLELGIRAPKLSEIRTSRSNNGSLCKISMADTWLRRDTEASWEKLADALEKTGNNAQAKNILEKHCGVVQGGASGGARRTTAPPPARGADNKRRRMDANNTAAGGQAAGNWKERFKAKPQAEMEEDWMKEFLLAVFNNEVKINEVDVSGRNETILHHFVKVGNLAAVKTLIALGADVNIQNDMHMTALDVAMYMHRSDQKLLQVIKDVGGRSNKDVRPEQESWGAQQMETGGGEEQTISKTGDRVLCLDNSSTMALVQLELLAQIEKATGKKITELFQWIVASGIGGLLMLLMVYGEKSIEDLRHFYYQLYDRVFDDPEVEDVGKALEVMVIDELSLPGSPGNALYMKSVKKPKLVIGAVNKRVSTLDLKFFSNCPSIQEDDMHVWKVARYTCSSPLYFGEYDNFIDTGVLCKNLCCVALEKIELFYVEYNPKVLDPLSMVVSLGDGYSPAQPLGETGQRSTYYLGANPTLRKPKDLLSVFQNMVALYSSAASYHSETVSSALCTRWCESRDVRFFRFNPLLEKAIPVPEEASIGTLIDVAIGTIAHFATGDGKDIMEKIKKEL